MSATDKSKQEYQDRRQVARFWNEERRCQGLPEICRQLVEIECIYDTVGIEVALLPGLATGPEASGQKIEVDGVDVSVAVGVAWKQLLGRNVSLLDIILADAQIARDAAIESPLGPKIRRACPVDRHVTYAAEWVAVDR